MTLTSIETWALDWLKEYEIKEKERDAATSYLSSWWRYAALSRTAREKGEALQAKKTHLYHNAVVGFNNLRSESAKLHTLDSYTDGSTAEDFERAEADLNAILDTLPKAMEASHLELRTRLDKMEEQQEAILAQLDALLSA